VQSKPDVGSIFWVELPLPAVSTQEWEAANAARQKAVPELAGKRILVVDDNEINREIARGLLSEMGCQVLTAEGGHEALALLKSDPMDMALVDLEMPGMDGFSLTKEIRSSPEISALPLIAMTAHVMGETRPLAAAAGLNGYLTKPIDMELLQAELLRFLGNPATTTQVSEKIMESEAVSAPPPEVHVDVEHALKLLGGNESIYHFMVRRFCETWANVRDQFQSAGDFETKRRLAHTLKGLCASLGCQQVSDLAASVEHTYRSEKEPEPQSLETLFRSVESLRTWLERNVPTA
jgi:two-component system, sensor histidine kinase and response regulator